MLEVRRYSKADHAEVLRIHVLAMETAGAYKGPGPWDEDLERIEETYLDGSGEFLIGRLEGRLVAMGAFKKSDPGSAEIKRMRVHPESQGRGFGRRILEELERRARSLGYRRLHLETSVVQIAAQGLYRGAGFLEAGREMIDGWECLLFEKRLDPAERPA